MTLAIAAFAAQTIPLMGAAVIPAPPPAAPSPAAESSPTQSSPTPTPSSEPRPAFTFAAASFSPTNAVRLTGTKDAGSSVIVAPLVSGGRPLCTIKPSDSTDFSCVAALVSGRAIVLNAIETLDGVASAPRSVTVDVLGAPTIDGAPGYSTSGLVSGYGFAGSTVTTVLDDGVPGCSSVATEVGFWSCALNAPAGPHVVRATQSRADLGNGASSSLSGSLSLVVDRDAPAPATITSPAAGTRVTAAEVTISGTGEIAAGGGAGGTAGGSAGIADLYLDNVPACQTAIVGGRWSCSVRGVSRGAHSLLVIQRDTAGNYSLPSVPITVYFGAKGGSIIPGQPARPSPPESPSGPSQIPGTPPSSTAPTGPAPDASAPTPPPGFGSAEGWSSPTAFGATIPTVSTSFSNGVWFGASFIALIFIVLIALPLRLLAGALRGRVRTPSLRVTGRNRSRRPPRSTTATPVGFLGALAVPLAAAAVLIMLAVGVDDQLRYLRLTVAVVLGLGLLNLASNVVAHRIASHLGSHLGSPDGSHLRGLNRRVRFVPLLLLATLLAATLSRATGIHPPLIAGVMVGIGFTGIVSARARAIGSLVEIGTVTVLATLAWILHGLFAAAEGFWALLAGEILTTVAFAGLGSVVILVLPIATLPGRAVFEWSKPVWLATITTVAALNFVVILGGNRAPFPIVGWVLAAGAFAVLSVAVWGWLRFVEPRFAADPARSRLC